MVSNNFQWLIVFFMCIHFEITCGTNLDLYTDYKKDLSDNFNFSLFQPYHKVGD